MNFPQEFTHIPETREKILLAAKKEFAEKGYDGARMGAIAKRAQVNQALIHYYFESKENLYVQVLYRIFGVEQKFEEKYNIYSLFFGQFDFTPSLKLHIAIYFLVRLHSEISDADFNKILAIEFLRGRRSLREIIGKYFIPRLERIEQIILDGIQSGEFETSSSILVVMQLVFFTITYESNRENYYGTRWFERLYGENYRETMLTFILENTFKALRPKGKELYIPEIPTDVKRMLDAVIEAIINENKGDTHDVR